MELCVKMLFGRSLVYRHTAAAKKLLSTAAYVPPALCRSMSSSRTDEPVASTPATPTTIVRITDNLSFRPAIKQSSSREQRPIVLIYAWLLAKARHIHKFGDFYLDKGFDVLHIKVGARQILWPPIAQSVVSQVVDFVTSPERRSQPIFVHGFSVGGYLYGETIMRMSSDPALQASMSKRIKGQVFDSPVDFEGVPHGVSKAVTGVPLAQLTIKSSLDAYMTLFHNQVTVHYHQSSAAFRDNPLRTPSLVLYSRADIIGPPGPVESVIAGWRDRSVPVWSRCWQDSPHVGHYLHDPVNYTLELNRFLHNIGLTTAQQHTTARDSGGAELRSKL